MAYLVLRFAIWTAIFTCLFWRSLAIVRIGVRHLQRLHQIPCSKCVYFTGDYRLKCTVQPIVAMSEEAIGCGDFLYRQQNPCKVCMAANQCDRAKHQPHPSYKPKFTYSK